MTTCFLESQSAGSSRPRGFTLLEMVVVMCIVAMLLAAVFGIVGSVTSLADSITVEQQREARIHAFVELCTRTYCNLPPSGFVRLRNQQSGARLASELTFGGATSPLSGETTGIFVLECREASDGYFQVVLRQMSLAQAVAWQGGDTNAGVRIPLLERVARLEWRFFDERSGEWVHLWNEKSRLAIPTATGRQTGGAIHVDSTSLRPTLVELSLAFGVEQPQRYVFWVPPAAPNPS
jgi:prepilin-type N-terminal cleavage/methylation domain-containing protein